MDKLFESIKPKPKEQEDYCDFCVKNYIEITPEKERCVLKNKEFQTITLDTIDEYGASYPYFRRVANLFEIVSYHF